MSTRVLSACVLALLAGCGQAPDRQAPVTVSAVEGDASETVGPAGAVDQAQLDALVNELTQVVRRYGVEQRHAPKNLDELVAHGYLRELPAAPSGKQFAIDKNLQVYVADR